MKTNKDLMLYVHIPFCVRKCNYCDFLSFGQDTISKELDLCNSCEGIYDKYIDVLVKEIELKAAEYKEYNISSIFIGGGTPSILPVNSIEKLFKAVKRAFNYKDNIEFTIESNPGTLSYEKLVCYKNNGVNRLSIGLQSVDNNELKRLGRIHSYENFLDNYSLARRTGFNNINVDIIASLPGQSYESFVEGLSKVIDLRPEHISCYGLIIEEGTIFFDNYKTVNDKEYISLNGKEYPLPSEDDERRIYYKAREILENSGYYQYEISNYSLLGKECKHNLGYWERRNYLGLGLGASSLLGNERWKNQDKLKKYMDSDFEKKEVEVLSVEDEMSEFIFLGLRKVNGINVKEFADNFARDIFDLYEAWTSKMISEELLIYKDDMIKLSHKGMDLANYVMSGYV